MNAAYVAGFFDADGCLSLRYGREGRAFSLYAIVVQKNNTVTQKLLDYYGGSMGIVKRGKRTYYRWVMSGQAVRVFLTDIEPYVIDKREQVLLGIDAIDHQKECGNRRYLKGVCGIQPLSKHAKAYRKSMWLRMKELNTCHKSFAAAETKSSDPEKGCDSPALAVMSGGAAKAPAIRKIA